MYKNISDYGLLGDMYGIALVSRDGSIDYCSMPELDSPTVFASILDDDKGGYFSIYPKQEYKCVQEYVEGTNILCSDFTSGGSSSKLYDFFPINESTLYENQGKNIHRCLTVEKGSVDFILKCYPRPEFAEHVPVLRLKDNKYIFESEGKEYILLINLKDYKVINDQNGSLVIEFTLEKGEAGHFDFVCGSIERVDFCKSGCGYKETQNYWRNWLDSCVTNKIDYLGEYKGLVKRSLLALKLLTYKPTGAIIAAATTSLPEELGGERNWDYRFTWIRDASFTLKALFSLGYITEADGFIQWLNDTYRKSNCESLQIMYSIRGESCLTEEVLNHLKGYKDSYPVRVGNAAYDQKQWDIYGEVMDTALRISDYAGKIDSDLWPFFRDVCNLAAENWCKPDDGIWEVRNGPFHFVYSKVMCWVALDRGIKISKRYGFEAPLDQWNETKEKIKEEVLKKGFDKKLNSFIQAYDVSKMDASLLLIPLMGFLPFSDHRVIGTISACKARLLKDGFLLRYEGYDGLKGEEGAFVLCNFWLIECLAHMGGMKEAKDMLKVTLKAANHLGLFSEEFEYKSGELLGNFPQAFSHIGLINVISAMYSIENKTKKDSNYESILTTNLRKKVAYKIVLNEADGNEPEPSKDIAKELKMNLNRLQGAFFDTMESKVNYKNMRVSDNYKSYMDLAQKLNSFDLSFLDSENEKKAFWVNIYNILIIHGVIELDIKSSVREVFHFFNRIGYNIAGKYFTPEDIEHGILRKNRPMPGISIKKFFALDKRNKYIVDKFDPRIHFALVCASSSCPPIEFYDSDKIDEQLNIAARSFMNRNGLSLIKKDNKVMLSQIFKWYASDFGRNTKDILKYTLQFVDENIAEYINQNINRISISYLPYNWNLNDTI